MQQDWTEKYRPASLSGIIGNDLAIKSLKRWAESWRQGVPKLKAIVLRGEPGTGKTSAALALANDMGWDLIEMNASDHRNAASIKNVAGLGAVNQTFALDGQFMSSSAGKRKLIVIDEADNLFGREDYGGAKAIVDTIKEAGQPLLLIVNDYYELSRKAPAIKTMAQAVFFNRLSDGEIITMLKSIADKESIGAPESLLNRIAENAEGDARAAVNDLQMMVEGRTDLEMDHLSALGKRNQQKELNQSLSAMYSARTMREARDATRDLDKTPDELEKWIEESIPQEFRDPSEMANAFDALSRSDIYLGWTRMLQHYGLWAYAKEMMTGGVVLSRKQGQGARLNEYRFPSHFIVMSRAKGPRAAMDSLCGKLTGYFHTSRKVLRDSVVPLLAEMSRNDSELLVHIGQKLELDESDVAYLLGEEPGSKPVSQVMAMMQKPGAEEVSQDSKRRRSGAGRGRGSSGRF